jgi:hypothetical protein
MNVAINIEAALVGRHELGVKIIYVTGTATDPANKGSRIWYSVIGQGETPPANPDDLRKSFFTKRKKDVIEFDFGDSGKTVYFAVQVEIYLLLKHWQGMRIQVRKSKMRSLRMNKYNSISNLNYIIL